MSQTTSRGPRPVRPAAILLALAALSGCASFSPDGGLDGVAALSRARIGQAPALQRDEADIAAAAARAADLLREPLTEEAAVQVAFLSNRHLQARLAALGLAEAARVRLGRLPNPSISWGRVAGGGEVEVDRGVTADLLALLLLPARDAAGARRFRIAQLQAAAEAVRTASAARRAWVEAVAARQDLDAARRALDAADAASQVAASLAAAGNVSAQAHDRAAAFRAEAHVRVTRADAAAVAARERLVRALGLSDPAALRLPDALPALPAAPRDGHALEQAAMSQRLDVQVAAREAEATGRDLGLARSTRFVNVLEAGWQDRLQTGTPRQQGPEVRLELPLFDGGAAGVAEARAAWLGAMHEAAAVATDARSQVREAWSAYRAAWDVAREYRDEVVPLRGRILDGTLRQYNGMLVDVFELLADARAQVEADAAAGEALRDFWLADADLADAVQGGPPPGAAAPAAAPAAASAAPRH